MILEANLGLWACGLDAFGRVDVLTRLGGLG